MKVSCIPICFFQELRQGTMSHTEWLRMAARLGLDGVEMYVPFLKSEGEDYLKGLFQEVQDLGLQISMVTGYGDLAHPNSHEWQKAVDEIKRNVDMASLFRSKVVRVVAGSWHEGAAREALFENVTRGLRDCLDYATPHGVHLALEDHPQIGTKIEDFVEIIERVGRDDLKVNLDTSNPMVSGQSAAELVELVKDRVVHLHASDRNTELEHTVAGEGVVDFQTIFRVLKHEAGFDGWISLEAGGTRGEDGIRTGIEYVRQTWEKA